MSNMTDANAPRPWRVIERAAATRGRSNRVIVTDADHNDVAEIYGETLDEARAIAAAIVATMNAGAIEAAA